MDGLVCKDVAKFYDTTQALSNVNLTIEKGKIYGLIGRNGAGKTTLLSMLSAQGKPSFGQVTLDDEIIWENENALSRMCFSRELNLNKDNFISYYLSVVSIKDYLKLGARYFPNWNGEMANKLLEEFELKPWMRIGKLSKGMLSIITIIVGMASKAEYTFLDEPVASLDVFRRRTFYKILLEEYEKTNRTFVISTHIIEEGADVFEEVIVLKDNKVMQKENTQDLIGRGFRISGKEEDVDKVTNGLTIYHVEVNGRKKEVTVLLEKNQKLIEGVEVSVQPLTLEKIFIDLCHKGDANGESI